MIQYNIQWKYYDVKLYEISISSKSSGFRCCSPALRGLDSPFWEASSEGLSLQSLPVYGSHLPRGPHTSEPSLFKLFSGLVGLESMRNRAFETRKQLFLGSYNTFLFQLAAIVACVRLGNRI